MPKVLDIAYVCQSCGWEAPDDYNHMVCPTCGGDLRGQGMPGVTGTRDGFGIGKNFMHTDDNGNTKEITTWREWEKAGYKNALDDIKTLRVKEMVKEKMKRIKHKGGKSLL